MATNVEQLRENIHKKLDKRYPMNDTYKYNFFWRDCPEFILRSTAVGMLTGGFFGSLAYIVKGRETYTTLIEDIAEKPKKPTVPKRSFRFLQTRTIQLSKCFFKGGIHGLSYGATSCTLRNNGFSDRSAVFGSGLVFTIVGRSLWAGGNTWYSFGVLFTVATTLLTFSGEVLMINDAHLTEEQARRARKRIDEKAQFIRDRIQDDTYYKDIYLSKNPDKDPKDYEFYSL